VAVQAKSKTAAIRKKVKSALPRGKAPKKAVDATSLKKKEKIAKQTPKGKKKSLPKTAARKVAVRKILVAPDKALAPKAVSKKSVLKRDAVLVVAKRKQAIREITKKPVRPLPAELSQKPMSVFSMTSHNHLQASGPKYFFSTDIPDHYNETYMRAMPRDPLWIFTYWEISQSVIDDLRAVLGDGFGSAQWILRVSDVTDIEYNGTNAWRSMDIDITPNADNWYIKIWEPGRVYLVQGGIMTHNGVFSEAVRSNTVTMPRAGVSAVADEDWSAAARDDLIGMSVTSLKRSIGASERLEESEIGIGLESGFGQQGSGSGAIL
jgi:hypothetical protein